LDVHLYQFKNLDTDVVLRLSQASEEPYAFEAFQKWKALPQSERGPWPSEKAVAQSRQKMLAIVKELNLPEKIINDYSFGGTTIYFPSKRHPQWTVGDWYSFSTTLGIIEHFTGNDFYFVLPEAKGVHDGHGFFRPDWTAAKMRLAGMLEELKRLEPAQLENYIPGLSESFDRHLSQIEVMIETLDFVLNSESPKEFLLYWSD
jgi:hypothetical protein